MVPFAAVINTVVLAIEISKLTYKFNEDLKVVKVAQVMIAARSSVDCAMLFEFTTYNL